MPWSPEYEKFEIARIETLHKWLEIEDRIQMLKNLILAPCSFCNYYGRTDCEDCPAKHLCCGESSLMRQIEDTIKLLANKTNKLLLELKFLKLHSETYPLKG